MRGVREDGIFLRGDTDPGQGSGELCEARYLHAADIVECTLAVGVATNTVGRVSDLSGDVTELRQKLIPLCRYAGARLAGIAAADAGHEQCLLMREAHRG